MAALVQTIPQQNGTITLLQTRPASATAGQNSFVSTSQISQPHRHNMSFSSYNGVNSSASTRNSVAPYAFTSTPGLLAGTGNSQQQQRQMSWSQGRPESLYSTSTSQNSIPQPSSQFTAGSVSSSSASSNSSSRPSYISQDDSILSSRRRTTDIAPRPLSTINLSTQPHFLDLSTAIPSPISHSPSPPPSTTTTSKPLPDRYRRGKRTTEDNSTTQSIPTRSTSSYELSPTTVTLPRASSPSVVVHGRTPSADDSRLPKQQNPEIAKRYRRRSWANMDALSQEAPSNTSLFAPLPELKFTRSAETSRPTSSHSEKSNKLENGHVENKSRLPASGDSKVSATTTSHNPSPLSNQVTSSPTPASPSLTPTASPDPTNSPAAQRLADISKANGGKKPPKSRLRRAFSFGSAAELRKMSAQNSMGNRPSDQLEQTTANGELDPEQAAIAAQQEANGLGNSIYSHQLGSTDNLSISSTASSASIMLRKMGRGMKKSTRSLVGLFRPKSISNVNTDPIVVEPTAPQVSVVNIEAERKTVTANPDLREQSGGGTVFPKIQSTAKSPAVAAEKKSQDANNSRKSIVGGERERAEVLAAVKKGILKREPPIPALLCLIRIENREN